MQGFPSFALKRKEFGKNVFPIDCRPTFPGMLRSIRKNFFHVVIMCDAASPSARPILKLAESFYVHRAPTKIGLVFQVIIANVLVLWEAWRSKFEEKKLADAFSWQDDFVRG